MNTGTSRDVVPAAWTRWQDWANLILGAWLFISPWVMRSTGSFNGDAWVVGGLIVLVSLWALAMPTSGAAEWSNIVLGIWLFISPWVLRYFFTTPTWNAWIVGILVIIFAAWALSSTRGSRGVRA